MTTEQLFDRVGLTNRERYMWFRGAQLYGTVLTVQDDEDVIGLIRRCYLPRLQAVVPGLELRQSLITPKPKKSIWKAGHEPTQEDML